MIAAITSALTQILTWFGTVIESLIDSDGALSPLLPCLAIGIAISLVFVGVKMVRRITWSA